MATPTQMTEQLRQGAHDAALEKLYGSEALPRQKERYTRCIATFAEHYGDDRDISIYSAPGRTEIGGNHTDHNNGLVLAAAVNLDIIAVVAKSESATVRLRSEGFSKEDVVDIGDLAVHPEEEGRSSALIRGVAAGIAEAGGQIGGFDAFTTSDVLKGSGLSSSAAFEVCLGEIFNGEFCEGRFNPVQIAMFGQRAENVFFGKPSGLMDQTACSVGSVVGIDFEDPANPVVQKVELDTAAFGCALVITDTKGDHADLTSEYAAIRAEMEQVAQTFGQPLLRRVPRDAFMQKIPALRQQLGDRAVLRAIHYYEECRRVPQLIEAIRAGEYSRFLALITESGHSSFEYNQNAYASAQPKNQGVPLGLALSQLALDGRGAYRLQGGGFAGTIQAFVPLDLLDAYCGALGAVFGADACHVLSVRGVGGTRVI